jgi:hypothetical protein
VDDQTRGKHHKLYGKTATGPTDRQAYAYQFRWGKNSAIQHIQQASDDNYHHAIDSQMAWGMTFWQYQRAPGDWVALDNLRK